MTGNPVDNEMNSGPSAKQATVTGVEGLAEAKDRPDLKGVWQDEKATANAKHDRPDRQSGDEPLGDALNIGAGQVSSPYLTVTQADVIAKQTNRNNGK
ncbi:hypothetical protein [Rhizobium tubonense]|uniref:Uncharacterized protein n=1 Tax=Rhizobium tubonense TaxID=484088 RepID=A0A2W4D082_9HYPH|nr:hypothetical protein [Rhizobium tubonense]PZM10894.1 hypothetical protein CPY51_21765 [Rhizobium tubonense]